MKALKVSGLVLGSLLMTSAYAKSVDGLINTIGYDNIMAQASSTTIAEKRIEKHYFDTSEMDLILNGISLSIKISNNKAELKVKVREEGAANHDALKVNLGDKSSSDKFTCKMEGGKGVVLARQLVKNPSRILKLDDTGCKSSKKNPLGFHPAEILEKFVGDNFKNVDVLTKVVEVQSVFPLKIKETIVDVELIRNEFDGGYKNYAIEVDFNAEVKEDKDQLEKDILEFIIGQGTELTKDKMNNGVISLMIEANKTEEIKKLIDAKQLELVQRRF